MLATLIVVFREMIEAGLVVGIILAATRGVKNRGIWVGYGIFGGIIGACFVAIFAGSISNAIQGTGQELFNVTILVVAVLMLTWHNVWMERHGRDIAMSMKVVGAGVTEGKRPLMALSVVVGIAILREGAEVVLFLYGIAVSGSDTALTMALGGVAGALFGALVSALMYFGLLRIHSRYFFKFTSGLIVLLAAGMASQATAFLQQAQIITSLSQVVWDTSTFIPNTSVTGKILHTLIGYTDRPTLLQLFVYVVTLFSIIFLMRIFGRSGIKSKIA